MKDNDNNRIIYSINTVDIRAVANELLGRSLTNQEVIPVGDSVGDYLDWTQAIENVIQNNVTEWSIFGDSLEGLAIHINKTVFNGNKSAAEGIDLEFNSDGVKYIVAIKSGPNWGNYSQIQKMKDNFNKAKRILQTSNSKMNIIAVNGCCYGVDNQPDKGEYQKLCGQRFWQFMSGDESLFTQIIEPLGHEARERNEEFLEFYAQIITKFTCSFAEKFCNDGKIDWERLVIFNSGNKK